jgi:hypothetical protein
MSRQRPSLALSIDANILLSALLGGRTRATISTVGSLRSLVVTAEAIAEVERVLLSLDGGDAYRTAFIDLVTQIQVMQLDTYAGLVAPAADALRNAPASRNGSDRDAHILALAWLCDADIWSHDRDYAGTGWPSWSSANLAAALAATDS